jgi:hypothetical protein
MLSKLLKHEFRATGRILLPVYLLLALSTGLFCLTMHLKETYDFRALAAFRGLVVTVFVITLLGAGIVTLLLMVYRFYKNYMTEEGYLMFTLPVTTAQLIWSKLIVALVWSLLTALATFGALTLAAVGSPNFVFTLPDFGALWQYLQSQLSTGQIIAFIAEFSGIVLFGALGSFLMFYAAIALGHSFANHKIFLSVVFYLLFSLGLQTVVSFGGIYGIIAAMESDFFDGDPLVWLHQISLVGVGSTLLFAAVFYVVTHLMLKKRLNLQ